MRRVPVRFVELLSEKAFSPSLRGNGKKGKEIRSRAREARVSGGCKKQGERRGAAELALRNTGQIVHSQ
jgi:hypothetical protein